MCPLQFVSSFSIKRMCYTFEILYFPNLYGAINFDLSDYLKEKEEHNSTYRVSL